MSDTPSSKDKKVDFILLGSAAILFLGLFFFGSPAEKHGSDEHEAVAHEEVAAQTPAEPEVEAKVAKVAETPKEVVTKPVAVKVKPAIVPPNINPAAFTSQPTIESLQKENAELKARLKSVRELVGE